MASPFDVLRIDSSASEEEITRAYRRRLKETHPDQGGTTAEFRSVRAAYEAITAGARRGGESALRDDVEVQPRRTTSKVEYLDYTVLDDYGWTLDDEDLFERAAGEGFAPADHGRFAVEADESLLEAAENRGFAWPFACRGGACANCAVAVLDGELAMPVNHILPPELVDRGFRLSCTAVPITDEMKVVYNVKHLPGLDELRLPPYPFDLAHIGD